MSASVGFNGDVRLNNSTSAQKTKGGDNVSKFHMEKSGGKDDDHVAPNPEECP